MKRKYTAFDLAAYAFTGALVMAFLWFFQVSYGEARQMGYTPDARAHMDYLAEVYNTDHEYDFSNVRPLSVDDLK